MTSGHRRVGEDDMPSGSRFFSKPYHPEAVASAMREMLAVLQPMSRGTGTPPVHCPALDPGGSHMSSRVHGIIDYLVAGLLLLAPYLFGFANGGPAQMVPTVLAIAIIIVSLLTRYELSVAKVISYPIHLVLDILVGLALLVSPWLFNFADQIWWPHVLVGLVSFIVVALSWSRRRATLG